MDGFCKQIFYFDAWSRRSEMREDKEKDREILTFEKEVINQRGEVVQTGTTTVLVAKRGYKREG
jgi:acyl dehydratase